MRPRSNINIMFTWARSVQVKINTEHILVALLFILLFADPCLLSTICSSAVSLNVICTIRLRAHHASSTGLISVFFSQQQPKEVPASQHNAPDGTANEGPHVFLQTPQYVLLHTQYITIYVLTISTWYTNYSRPGHMLTSTIYIYYSLCIYIYIVCTCLKYFEVPRNISIPGGPSSSWARTTFCRWPERQRGESMQWSACWPWWWVLLPGGGSGSSGCCVVAGDVQKSCSTRFVTLLRQSWIQQRFTC